MEETSLPFGVALRDLMIEYDYVTSTGRPNWSAFAAELQGVHYETLRMAVTGDRRVSVRLMEECARVLRISPDYFLEYRVDRAQRDFDPHEVGLERALENLRVWGSARGSPSKKVANS